MTADRDRHYGGLTAFQVGEEKRDVVFGPKDQRTYLLINKGIREIEGHYRNLPNDRGGRKLGDHGQTTHTTVRNDDGSTTTTHSLSLNSWGNIHNHFEISTTETTTNGVKTYDSKGKYTNEDGEPRSVNKGADLSVADAMFLVLMDYQKM